MAIPSPHLGVPNVSEAQAPARAAVVQPILTGLLIGAMFLLVFMFALHKPTPHDVPVGVVGTTGALAANPALHGLKLRDLPDVAAARRQIADGTIYAAYDGTGGSAELLVSSAHGAVATRTIEGMFAAVAGHPLPTEDVVPVSKEDPNGVSVFYLIFGVTLGAFLFGQAGFATAPHLPARMKLAQTAVFAVLLGLVAALIARVWIGMMPGPVLAETGVLILLAATVGLFTIALTTLLKDAGVAVSTLVALILGTAISGGPVPADFLPTGFAVFSGTLPPGAAVNALRDLAYYDAGSAYGPILIMAAWLAVAAAVVAGVALHRSRSTPEASRPGAGGERLGDASPLVEQ